MDRHTRSVEDVLRILDGMFAEPDDFWTRFYADRDRPVPFFVAKPDENLVSYLDRGLVTPGRALDVGCGPGRNALHLAEAGFAVDAIDLSPTAIRWAQERDTGGRVRFTTGNLFTADLDGPYDLIYDSGCFHHLPPHRRISYLEVLDRQLAPGGHFGLAAFARGGMGSERPDADLYRDGKLDGGLAFTDAELRWLFQTLTEVELRRMNDEPADSVCFGEPFLWTALFCRS